MVRIDSAMSKADDAAASIFRDFGNSAGCSMEQIFTPLSIYKDGNSPTPGFRPNVNLGNDRGLFSQQSVGPTIRELNPYFPVNIIKDDSDGSAFFKNCDYNAVVMEPATDLNRKKTNLSVVEAVRTKGLRTPVILSGWGFDLCDTPVPYVTQGEKRFFDISLVNDRRYWKTGPLHVMWDEERQVWSGGPQIVIGTAITTCIPGKRDEPTRFTIRLHRAGNTADTLTEYGEEIVCKNRDPLLTINIGQWVVAARINYEWVAIQAGGSSIIIGTFDGEWNKNDTKNVTALIPDAFREQLLDDYNRSDQLNVTNLFADVGKAGNVLQRCAFTGIEGVYYLIAAECG